MLLIKPLLFSCATKERSKVINRDWIKYYACNLSYYINVVPNLNISKNDFMKLSAKIIASIYFYLNLYSITKLQ